MIIARLIEEINELADEQEDDEIVLAFINDAIARINIECDSIYPSYLTSQINEVVALPEKWARTLLIPFGVGRLKQKDSSQFEYVDAYNEFLENLNEFKAKYEIPEEFKDPNSLEGGVKSDIYENPPFPWFTF